LQTISVSQARQLLPFLSILPITTAVQKNKEQIETYLLKKRPVLLFQVALEEFLVMT
jgi:hypothetical protein